jgi:hypothetical protein
VHILANVHEHRDGAVLGLTRRYHVSLSVRR